MFLSGFGSLCMSRSYEVSVICQMLIHFHQRQSEWRIWVANRNENTGAVKVPFFDFGEIVETKLRSQAEKLISSFNSHLLIMSDEGVMCKSDFWRYVYIYNMGQWWYNFDSDWQWIANPKNMLLSFLFINIFPPIQPKTLWNAR